MYIYAQYMIVYFRYVYIYIYICIYIYIYIHTHIHILHIHIDIYMYMIPRGSHDASDQPSPSVRLSNGSIDPSTHRSVCLSTCLSGYLATWLPS